MKCSPVFDAVPLQSIPATRKSLKKCDWKKTAFSDFKNHLFASETCQAKQCKPSAPDKGKTKLGESDEDSKNLSAVHNVASFDITNVPPPICSCTGVARQCHRAGPGGWQSKCCSNALSLYPLPWSLSNPAKRVSGRKMSKGAYRKLLRGLVRDGHDLSQPVDLKNHWAKHGTNKFATVK